MRTRVRGKWVVSGAAFIRQYFRRSDDPRLRTKTSKVQARRRPSGGIGDVLPALTLVSAALLLLLAGCSTARHYLHYRMTVEIETPQGLRTGSGVLEVRLREYPFFVPGPSSHFELKGEAIPVDLPNGQTIFALLAKPSDADLALRLPLAIFQRRLPEMLGPIEARRSLAEQIEYLRSRRPSATVEGDELPMLVRFGNPAEPRSVVTIGLGPRGEIGPGIRLRRIWIEITDDEVTQGIERRLPWVTSLNGSLSGGLERHPGNPALDVPTYAFTRGIF